MTVDDAVIVRIRELCQERHMAYNTLANNAGIPPSTLYSILNSKSANPGVESINKICFGFGISMYEFWHTKLFENMEFDIS